MTPEQTVILKALVLAEPSLTTARQTGNDGAIADWLNAPASPAFFGYRSNYTPEQIAAAIDSGITQVDGLSASKRETLLFWANRSHDATLPATIAAINDLCGSQNTLKAAVLDGAKRSLSRAEKALATGAGTSASPATPTWEGQVTSDMASSLR
jgi:hypothetical protein